MKPTDVNYEERAYQSLLAYILENGQDQIDRTGVGTRKVFDTRLEFDLSEGKFPLLTTKFVNLHGIHQELDWFLSGSRNARDLVAQGCNIWSNWIKPFYHFASLLHEQRPYIHHECKVNKHEHYRRLENNACLPIIDELVIEEIVSSRSPIFDVDPDSPYWKRQLEARARLSMQRNDNSVKTLFELWTTLLTKYTLPAIEEPKSKYNGFILCQSWLEFDQFFHDVQQLPNYEYFLTSGNDGSLRLTGIYDLDPILRPETAVFMIDHEYRLYKEQEVEGVWKVYFKEKDDGQKPPPQYYLHFEDIEHPCVRMTESLHDQIDRVDFVSLQDKPWRLRMAKSKGDLGPVYGFQWRNFNNEGIDQISNVIDALQRSPYSRRHVVSCWNPAQLEEMALAPCHYCFQLNVVANNKEDDDPQYQLDLKFTMRSDLSAFVA